MLRKIWKILWISVLSFFGIGFAGAIIFAIFRTTPEPSSMQYKSVDYTLTPEEQGLKVGDWIKVSGGCEFDEDTGNIAVRLTTVPPPVQTRTNLVRIEGIGYQYPNLEAGSTIIVTGRISEILPPFEYSEGDYLPQYRIVLDPEGCTVTASSP